MNLTQIGEAGLIEQIKERFPSNNPRLLTPIGDDAAVLDIEGGKAWIITTDLMVEGVSFDLSLTTPRLLGRKSLAVNISDIAAMGGKPLHFLTSLALPSHTEIQFIEGFHQGIKEVAEEFGLTLLGGDTSCAETIMISITLIGQAPKDEVVYRRGAHSGELLFVTGTLGDSALGLCILRKGERNPAYNYLIKAQLDPSPRVEIARKLAERHLPTAMIDVSDGLLANLRQLCEASGVGARISLERIPLSAPYRTFVPCSAGAAGGSSPQGGIWDLALSGGEDYELIFTAERQREGELRDIVRTSGVPITNIGEITDQKDKIEVLDHRGEKYEPRQEGYDHFKARRA